MTSRLSVVVGAQYGSEGKGAIAGHLAKTSNRPVVCVRIGGPNAGHTVLGHGPEGNLHPWRLRTIPVAAVVDHQATLVIAAGSEIDLTVLVSEAEMLENWGHPVWNRLYIDPQATILDQTHIDTEQNLGIQGRLGSTAKGIGAARAARIMRTARLWGELTPQHRTTPIPTADYLEAALSDAYHVIVEGTQGYGLGLHAGHYPQCTSNDARAVDFLSMAGINPWSANVDNFTIYAVARTHPIRVAGNSGPLQDETTWEDLGLDPELTTVTRKVRRVGMWDPNLVRDAVAANGGAPTVALCLTMLDHVVPEVANYTGPISLLPEPAKAWIRKAEQDSGTRVAYVGTGPDTVAGSM